jgi:glycosyltransferase involved in cell wall biosynthesis
MTLGTHRALRELYDAEQWLLNLYVGAREPNVMLASEARQIFDYYMEQSVYDAQERRKIVLDAIDAFRPDIVMYANLQDVAQIVFSTPNHPPILHIQHSELSETLVSCNRVAVDAVITVSEAMGRNRIKDLKLDPEKVFPIQNGIDPAFLDKGNTLRDELEIPHNAIVYSMVGNMNSLKRPQFGLRAFAGAGLQNAYMIFAGNPEQAGETQKLAEELGIREKVRILGFRTDIENVYATVDVIMNCSVSEGMPMTLIEAAFAGIPAVATAVGGNPEVVLHGETGFLVDINDMQGMTDCLVALKDRDELARLGENALKRAERHFHIHTVAEKYMSVFRRFIIEGEEPRCSIVIPVYNAVKTITRTLDSIISQTMPHFECILVDDGSTDTTRNVLRRYADKDSRFRLYSRPHGGIVPTLNYGIEQASCGIIVRMDADDMMTPDRLERQLAFMEEHPDIDVVGSQMVSIDVQGSPVRQSAYPLTDAEIKEAMFTTNPLAHPTVAFRKKVWNVLGGYQGDGRAEDYLLWSQAHMHGFVFANMEEVLLQYRLTHDSDASYGRWVNSVVPGIQKRLRKWRDEGV